MFPTIMYAPDRPSQIPYNWKPWTIDSATFFMLRETYNSCYRRYVGSNSVDLALSLRLSVRRHVAEEGEEG